MADIRRYPLLRHYRGGPTDHVLHVRRGRVVHSGTGGSFWFRPLTAALSEIPVDDHEVPLLFHARSADFQDVAVQATVTFRVADPVAAATRLDFGLDPDTGRRRGNPLDQVASMLTELAQQHALVVVTSTPLREVIAAGLRLVRERVGQGLADDPRLADTGIEVVAVRVVAIRPEPDLERALQTPALEEVQEEADRATYQRRALAVERERAISENELQSRIELAAREESLIEQEGANQRRRAQDAAGAARIEAESRADRDRILAEARAAATRLVGQSEADVEAARLGASAGVDRGVLLALALRDLAANLPSIANLTVTPDLVTAALGRLAALAPAGQDAAAGPAPGERA